ncbi:MAG: hypothetical protein V8T87_06565 [Victivallales bacterium]
MILGENNEINTPEEQNETPAVQPGRQRISDLFRRDLIFWFTALLHRWWLLISLPLLSGILFFSARSILAPKAYSASTALVRQVADVRSGALPTGYVSTQFNVILNMILSRANLNETSRRLKLNYTHEQLFRTISIRQASRNSNYFFITATTRNPKLSADIANTLSEVFLEDYKKFIRTNIEQICESSIRSRNSLQKELDDLLSRKKRLYDENNISSLTQEQATNAQRIIIQEDRLLHAETQLDALQKKYDDLEVQLQTTPKIVELYSEQNISSDRKLADLKLELSSLRQRYTDNNPIVEKQKTLIKALEDSIRENKADDGKVKVVNGRNAEYINLSNEQHKIKAERTALKSTIATYTETLAKLKERRDKLDLLAPSLNLLEDQINQKRNLLLKQEALTKELQLFLDRSFTDVTIQETATVPTDPLPRRRPLFFLLGLFLGAVLSGGFVLGKEFINLSVRSKVDIEDALHIPALGIIPHFDHHCRADFYSALQGAVNQAEELLRGVEKTPAIIAIAPAQQEDLSTNILNEFCEILKVKRDVSYRIIRVAPEEQTSSSARYLVNDFLYGFTDTLPEPGKDQVLYFKLDDLAFISPPEEERIGQLRNTLQQFDLVIWELFEFELHRQLYSEICKSADLTVIPMRYGRTSKWQIYQTLLQLNTCKVQRIAGLLYDVENKIYRKVSL